MFDFLKDHQDEMVDDLRRFVEMESPSTVKDLLDRTAQQLADYAADKLGAATQVIHQNKSGNHVRIRVAGNKEPPILLLAHFDTVWPRGSLKSLPFRVEGGLAYGPGVFDMKGGLVQGLWALRALRELHSFERSLVLICNSDEETGSESSRALIEAEARKSKAVLVLEPSQNGNLKTARKGTCYFSVKVIGKAAHAGLDPTKGISAIEELSRIVLDLHSMTNMERGTTLNVGVIRGGTRPNVIAQEASAELDVRVPSKGEADRIIPKILGVKSHNPNATLDIHGGLTRPPMERTETTEKLFLLAQRVAGEMGVKLEECSVGSASDGNFSAALGVPTLDGLGAVGDGAHATDEHLVISEMAVRAALLGRLLLEL